MTVMSMSYFSLDMRNPKKCVVVNYPGTQLEVLYEIFDPNKGRLAAGVRMPDSALSQSKVTVEVFPPDGSTIRRTKENHLTKTLPDMDGKLKYSTDAVGTIHICAMIEELPGRKYPRPTLVGLRIIESGEMDEPEPPKKSAEDEKGQVAAKKHLSEMEKIMMGMIRDTNLLLRNADSIKEDESSFHQRSLEMNSASRWWPMMHVVVLLVTGFTQANHVIKFFKSMHII